MILEVGIYSKVSAGRIIADLSNERKERLLEESVLRRLVAEFVGRHYNKELFGYTVRKLEGRVRCESLTLR